MEKGNSFKNTEVINQVQVIKFGNETVKTEVTLV